MSDWTIAGAGSTGYNGLYIENGTHNGKPAYELDSGHWLFWAAGANWVLADSLGSVSVYYHGTGVDLPAEPWSTALGAAPAPTISSGSDIDTPWGDTLVGSGMYIFGIDGTLGVNPAMDWATARLQLIDRLDGFPGGLWIERVVSDGSGAAPYDQVMDGWLWVESGGGTTYQAGTDDPAGIHLGIDGNDISYEYVIDGVVVYSGTAIDGMDTCTLRSAQLILRFSHAAGTGGAAAINWYTYLTFSDGQRVDYDWVDSAQQRDWLTGYDATWSGNSIRVGYGTSDSVTLTKFFQDWYYSPYTTRPFVVASQDGSLRMAVPKYELYIGEHCAGLSALPTVTVYRREAHATWAQESVAFDGIDDIDVVCPYLEGAGWGVFPKDTTGDGESFFPTYTPAVELSGFAQALDGSLVIAMSSVYGATDALYAGALHTIVRGYDGADTISQVPGEMTLWRRTTDNDRWEYVGDNDRIGNDRTVYNFVIDNDNVIHAIAQDTSFDGFTYDIDLAHAQSDWPTTMEEQGNPVSLFGLTTYTTDEQAWWIGPLVPARNSAIRLDGDIIASQMFYSETFGRSWKSSRGQYPTGFPHGYWDPHESKLHLIARVDGDLYCRALEGTIPDVLQDAARLTVGEFADSIVWDAEWGQPIADVSALQGTGYEIALTRASGGDLWLMLHPLKIAGPAPHRYIDTYRSQTDGQHWEYIDRLAI